MSIVQIIILSIIGLSGGGLLAAGVFALITTTGVMTRFAEKTHTAKYVRQYENAVAFGAILFNIFWVFELNYEGMKLGNQLLALIGLCHGIFVGCLAISLAEALNATAIFARRMKLAVGLSFIVLSVALGKGVGALIYFFSMN